MDPSATSRGFKAMLEAPAERRPFTTMKDALEASGCKTDRLLLEWAALAEGRKVGLGFSDNDGRRVSICLEFGEGNIGRLVVLRPHSYSRELIVLVGDSLPPQSLAMAVSTTEFSISFESYLLRTTCFELLPWNAEENTSDGGYSLDVRCCHPLRATDLSPSMGSFSNLLDSFAIHAKAAPTGFYILEPV